MKLLIAIYQDEDERKIICDWFQRNQELAQESDCWICETGNFVTTIDRNWTMSTVLHGFIVAGKDYIGTLALYSLWQFTSSKDMVLFSADKDKRPVRPIDFESFLISAGVTNVFENVNGIINTGNMQGIENISASVSKHIQRNRDV